MPSVKDIESARATAGGRFNGDVGLMLTRVRGGPFAGEVLRNGDPFLQFLEPVENDVE